MPPKKPATSSAPGPSNTGQGTAGDRKVVKQTYHPTIDSEWLDDNEIMEFAFLYKRYHYNGRPLSHEEVCDMWGLWKRKNPTYKRQKGLFDELDKVDGAFTAHAEEMIEIEGNTEILQAQADSLVDQLRKKENFRERLEIYDGL